MKNIIAMIPARMGSTRLKKKNLALLGGEPLIHHAVRAAKDAQVFDEIVINSEDTAFADIAEGLGISFYQRPAVHATSQARSDEVVLDFIRNNPCRILVWVNSIAPLQPPEEIREVVDHFRGAGLDSLITVKREQVHALYEGKPLNYNPASSFARTQDLEPVELFVYSLMMWRADAFLKQYEEKGHAIICGRFGTYPVSKRSQVIIKYEEDLRLAESLLRAEKERDR